MVKYAKSTIELCQGNLYYYSYKYIHEHATDLDGIWIEQKCIAV